MNSKVEPFNVLQVKLFPKIQYVPLNLFIKFYYLVPNLVSIFWHKVLKRIGNLNFNRTLWYSWYK